jgi:hypothetical protein
MTQLIHPDLGNGLTNHQPMVVSALRELGATKSHIVRYNQMMAEKTKIVTEDSTHIVDDTDLINLFGAEENYSGIHAYLSQQQQGLGSRGIVNKYVPMLADGISGAAFHPIIRLGHAVHDFNDEEVVAALAYWVWAYQTLAWPEADDASQGDMANVIEHLLDDISWGAERIGRPTITEEFDVVTQQPSYQLMRFRLKPDSVSYEKLRNLAIQSLWMHDDFTLLHGVTGVQAVGRINLWLDDKQCLLEPMWKGLVVAWLSKGLRWKNAPLPALDPQLSIEKLRVLAAHATRDHTIKLVAACLEQYRVTQDKIYWHVAEREVKNDNQLKLLID